MIRVYANLRGLSKKYRELMPDSASFEDFVRGFNTVHPMCDFIDAGCGKECADEKIKGKLPQLFTLSYIHFFLFSLSMSGRI